MGKALPGDGEARTITALTTSGLSEATFARTSSMLALFVELLQRNGILVMLLDGSTRKLRRYAEETAHLLSVKNGFEGGEVRGVDDAGSDAHLGQYSLYKLAGPPVTIGCRHNVAPCTLPHASPPEGHQPMLQVWNIATQLKG